MKRSQIKQESVLGNERPRNGIMLLEVNHDPARKTFCTTA